MAYVLAFLGFAALIVLHELGHFAAAKAVGMRVERFSLFFGPMVAKVRRGETEYGIGVIPLGGYVRISGMNPHEELPPEVAHRAYYKQKTWKRIVVISAGPAVNVVVAFILMFCIYLSQGKWEPNNTVASVGKGTAAAEVLRPGDRIVAVDGVRGDTARLREAIGEHRCAGAPRDGCRATTPLEVTIERDGRTITATATPSYSAEAEQTVLGFNFDGKLVGVPASDVASLTITRMWDVSTATVSVIGRVFVSSEARDQVGGVVGSYNETRKRFEFDTTQALLILALISLSLAIVNLFPFLPLDGGHIFWALAEKVRGRPIPFSVLERASAVGFVLIMFLFVIGLTNDIDRLRGEGLGIR